MKDRTYIAKILEEEQIGQEVTVKGWVKTFRNNQFIALNDGSSQASLQVVVDLDRIDDATRKRINPGTALGVHGKIVASQGGGQTIELIADELKIYGDSDAESYPLQPKRHSLEFLRDIGHLRARTNTFSAIFRIRNRAAYAIHEFFQQRGFYYVNTPILTASDAEGAGEMFCVTSMNLDDLPRDESGAIDYNQDFFQTNAHLTVSGQLEAELFALALGNVYTFGPTFRAENSNTSRHLAEFWMVEPEMAFADLVDDMDMAEAMLKYVIRAVVNDCKSDLEFLQQRLINEEKQLPQQQRSPMPLLEKLDFCLQQSFERVTYTDAIEILKNSKPNKKGKFKFPIESWGADLQSEHERFLVEKHFGKPVIIYDYPKDIKAFYMKMNEDNKTVAAMDILFPGIGEIVGGSQREDDLKILDQRMTEMDIPLEEMNWYRDIRRYGSCPHAGYGLGFERLLLFLTGMGNIRDVIPFPRTPQNAEF